MTINLGIDIGGTKIAVVAYGPEGSSLFAEEIATPDTYDAFLQACSSLVTKAVEQCVSSDVTVGICTAGAIDHVRGTVLSENIRYLNDKPLRDDLERTLGCTIRIENDMNCLALAEAIDGAGQGYDVVHCITLSTGVGSGLVVHQRIMRGANGLAGEIGHVPLPFRESGDAPLHPCICRQDDCIEKAICGGGLKRLYHAMTGGQADPPVIAAMARQGDARAIKVLDRYYHMVAKALVVSLHVIDPDVIVLTGGLSRLPDICQEVTARWGTYCLLKEPKTKLVLAEHGATAGARGAAFLWRV